jgi:hypothetical protein
MTDLGAELAAVLEELAAVTADNAQLIDDRNTLSEKLTAAEVRIQALQADVAASAGAPPAAGVQQDDTPCYESAAAFHAGVLVPLIAPDMPWCPQWWEHPGVVERVHALWEAWEALAALPTGRSDWLRGHWDHHSARLHTGAGGLMHPCNAIQHAPRRRDPIVTPDQIPAALLCRVAPDQQQASPGL